jgi:pimeloyl-ACP methyl ester carboxylesterase
LRKVHFLNSRKLKIIGNYYTVDSDKIVILAHGFTNDKSSNGRFDLLSKALNESDYDALAIDFSGSGESDDAALTLENQVDDLKQAVDFVVSKGYSKIAFFGNSFGSVSCLMNYEDRINTMVLTGALTDKMHYKWHEYFTKEQMKSLEENGYFFTDDQRPNKITCQTLKDYESINQVSLLSGVNCPVLLIHGNNEEDLEEIMLLERSARGMEFLSKDSRLEIIEDGKHGLRLKWHAVIDLTVNWLEKYF